METRRRTKIIATLGPSVDAPGILEEMVKAGVDIVRINMSHADNASHKRRIELTREYALRHQREVGILVDLQGPKIRVSTFKDNKISLEEGQVFILDMSCPKGEGTKTRVGVDYPALINDVSLEDNLLLDDGRIVLKIESIEGMEIKTSVVIGGELSNNKGINKQGGGMSANPLTEKDKLDIVFAAENNADYIALSFPREKQDILVAKQLIQEAGSSAGIIAKIERSEAVPVVDSIIEVSDAVMVARGDLGVEIGFAEVPGIQKTIITKARALNKAVITATQMMESMIVNSIPTRAEVSDVANAVLDGTDAVMLSAETATGAHPVKVVTSMHNICLAAEKNRKTGIQSARSEGEFSRIDEAIAMASIYTANHFEVKAIICLTESGSTPLWMSRIRTGIPIFGLSRRELARRRMTLYRGVFPFSFDVTHFSRAQQTQEIVRFLKTEKACQAGDTIIITSGDVAGESGHSNTMKIVTVD